jgi:hypothetical protein
VIGGAACGMGCILAHRETTARPERLESTAALQSRDMSSSRVPSAPLRWFLVLLRVLLVTFLLALLSFAVCLFLGIMGLVVTAAARGAQPNLTIAYREIAFPAAILAGAAALVAAIVMEVRHHRQQTQM